MVEKAKHMTIAEMVEQYDFIAEIMRIPERTAERPIVMGYADDYGPGRHAKAEFSPETSGYDYLYAELCMEKDAEKARVRNRRKNDRKYKELPKDRKHREEMRKDRLYGYYGNYDCPKVVGNPDSLMIAERKRISAEMVIRKDYELELHYAEIEESFRKMDDAIKSEHLRNLNEWLKYA